MKAFLSDYGMVWVGESDAQGGASSSSGVAGGEGPSHLTPVYASSAAGPRSRPKSGTGYSLVPKPPDESQPGAPHPGIRRRSYTGPGSATSPRASHMPPAGDGGEAAPPGSEGGAGTSEAKPLTPPRSSGAVALPDKAPGRLPSHRSISMTEQPHAPAAAAADMLDAPGPSSPHPNPPPQSSPIRGPPFKLSVLLTRVEELNQLAGDGCGQLVPGQGAGGHAVVLHTPDPVRLVVFKDGLQLHRLPGKPYGDPLTDIILRDVLDGYFPSPLRTEFPEGVPIKVIDRSRDSLRDALSPVNHPALRGTAGGSNVRTFHDIESFEGEPLARDKFLAKLPQSVIRWVLGSMGDAWGLMAADANARCAG